MTENKMFETYLAFIKKAAAKKVWDKNLQDDIVQEVFIKLYNKGFFEENELIEGEVSKQAGAYIYTTVVNRFRDIYRTRGSKDTVTDSIDGDNDDHTYVKELPSPDIDSENSLMISEEARNAFAIVKGCFDAISQAVKGKEKLTFFQAAFWEFSDFGMTIKELAHYFNFQNSNPTQEFNRFVGKVSNCTEGNGVRLTRPNEQVEILMSLMGMAGE